MGCDLVMVVMTKSSIVWSCLWGGQYRDLVMVDVSKSSIVWSCLWGGQYRDLVMDRCV